MTKDERWILCVKVLFDRPVSLKQEELGWCMKNNEGKTLSIKFKKKLKSWIIFIRMNELNHQMVDKLTIDV